MRLYRGDIKQTYDRAIWPLGAVSGENGDEYTFVKIAASGADINVSAGMVLGFDSTYSAQLADGTNPSIGIAPIGFTVKDGETVYAWIQTKGYFASALTSEANSTDLTKKILVPDSANAGKLKDGSALTVAEILPSYAIGLGTVASGAVSVRL